MIQISQYNLFKIKKMNQERNKKLIFPEYTSEIISQLMEKYKIDESIDQIFDEVTTGTTTTTTSSTTTTTSEQE